jgi:peptidoglycan/LPS O-acetylase OafA/YrhL
MVAGLLVAPELARHTRLDWAQAITSYAFIAWPRQSDGGLYPLVAQGWTLNYEAFFYVCFALALLLRRGLIWLSAAFIGLSLVNVLIARDDGLAGFYSDPMILEFLAGIGFERLYRGGMRIAAGASVGLAVLAVGIYIAALSVPLLQVYRATSLGIPAAILAAAFIFAPDPDKNGPLRKALRIGGDASYTLYLSHAFVINAVLIVWRRLAIDVPAVEIVIGCGLAVTVALLFYRYVERPVTEALHRYFGFRRQYEAQMVAP